MVITSAELAFFKSQQWLCQRQRLTDDVKTWDTILARCVVIESTTETTIA
jgi:hypothetical protein